MRHSFSIRAAFLAAIVAGLGFGGAASAQEAGAPEEIVSMAPEAPVAPWYQEFTENDERYDLSGYPLDSDSATVEWDTGDRWGVSLGFRSNSNVRNEDLDELSAGAYFRVSPRVRVGGQLGYRAEQSGATGLRPSEEPAPQIKLESAFRF